ncbi:hypothetical protein [Vibrio alginolyticus]|uniref:hypothetical protein n=1 Tax=Vibrio TaxID=662 RepID=UPI0006CAA897|nr:hypothetical protein [Vibrio alginolyticus]KPM98375.1 hypothetical protein AOG25_07970 [Vibrio alginolyticus]CAH7130375.1 conserved hypothetical protein [Vibrio chagasii]CAH7221662.1 conserved hypothetical protein [Vibrio chagasii]
MENQALILVQNLTTFFTKLEWRPGDYIDPNKPYNAASKHFGNNIAVIYFTYNKDEDSVRVTGEYTSAGIQHLQTHTLSIPVDDEDWESKIANYLEEATNKIDTSFSMRNKHILCR